MHIWNTWKRYRHYVNHIFVTCVKQFAINYMMLIMFYSGLFFFKLNSFFNIDVYILFILLHIEWRHSFKFVMSTWSWHDTRTCSSSWLCICIASLLCWYTIIVNYGSFLFIYFWWYMFHQMFNLSVRILRHIKYLR